MELTREVRCFCSKRTLLAKCGIDTRTRRPFIWQKVYKQGRVFGEMIAYGGRVVLRCRDCGRWTEVHIHSEVETKRVDEPAVLLGSTR